jgi:hypothetical protein
MHGQRQLEEPFAQLHLRFTDPIRGHNIFIRDSGVKNYLISSYLTKLVA